MLHMFVVIKLYLEQKKIEKTCFAHKNLKTEVLSPCREWVDGERLRTWNKYAANKSTRLTELIHSFISLFFDVITAIMEKYYRNSLARMSERKVHHGTSLWISEMGIMIVTDDDDKKKITSHILINNILIQFRLASWSYIKITMLELIN